MASEGWGFLHNAKTVHYFRDGRSLCRRWLAFRLDELVAQSEDVLVPPHLSKAKDCAVCVKKRAKEAPHE